LFLWDSIAPCNLKVIGSLVSRSNEFVGTAWIPKFIKAEWKTPWNDYGDPGYRNSHEFQATNRQARKVGPDQWREI